MKKVSICFVILLIVMIGCGKAELSLEDSGEIEEQDVNQQMSTDVTNDDGEISDDNKKAEEDILMVEDGAKFMIEEYGFTEEELEGYDVTAFVNEYLYDYPTEEYARKRFERVKEYFRITDEYLFNKYVEFATFKKNTGKISVDDTIIRIGYRTYENTYNKLYIYDLEAGLAYYGDDISVKMEDYEIEDLKKIVSRYNIDAWENKFTGPNRDSTGSVGWDLSFLLEDGSVRCYTGEAEYYSDFTDDMKSVWSMLGR